MRIAIASNMSIGVAKAAPGRRSPKPSAHGRYVTENLRTDGDVTI
jgi:hypothetical protein